MVGAMSGLAAFAPAAFEQNTPRLPDSGPDEADT